MYRHRLVRTLFLLLSLILIGCQFPSSGIRADPTDSPGQGPAALQPTDTAVATAAPPRVIFLAPAAMEEFHIAELSQEVARLADQTGMVWEQRSAITPQEVPDGTKLLIAFETDPGLVELARVHPEVQFLAISIPGLSPASNLSLLGPEGNPYDRQAFVAGYVAALVGEDWRVGSLTVVDTAGGLAAQNGFLQGARFFCGQCRSAYPPYMDLPTFASLSSSDTDWSAAIETFRQSRIEVAYIFPTPNTEVILRNLEQSGMLLMGSKTRPSSLPSERWVATVRFDPASGLRELWEDLLLGQGGLSVDMPLVIVEVNEDLLSPGRLHLAEALIQDLLAGRVDTAVDPLTGESR